jgi:RsiW-degrading membrane proteinase PrsW (M82 family)
MPFYFYIIYFFLGFLPSFIWLLFYLRKDSRPEPNKMVIKVFWIGILSAISTALVQNGINDLLSKYVKIESFFPSFFNSFFYYFFVISFTEEFFKYFFVKETIFKSKELDEPVDIILYMIIGALGFAALENTLVLLLGLPFLESVIIMFFRFLGATFLHALSSGILGYFIVLSLYEIKKRKLFFSMGLLFAVLLHTLFNFYIINIVKSLSEDFYDIYLFVFSVFILSFLLLGSALFISFGIRKAKEIKSICKIK